VQHRLGLIRFPALLDIMELGGEQLVVTRMPIEDERGAVIGAIGFVLYHHLDSLKPLLARVTQLENELRLAKRCDVSPLQ
jgi:hypothetical protein